MQVDASNPSNERALTMPTFQDLPFQPLSIEISKQVRAMFNSYDISALASKKMEVGDKAQKKVFILMRSVTLTSWESVFKDPLLLDDKNKDIIATSYISAQGSGFLKGAGKEELSDIYAAWIEARMQKESGSGNVLSVSPKDLTKKDRLFIQRVESAERFAKGLIKGIF
jgi:hypothetical protein